MRATRFSTYVGLAAIAAVVTVTSGAFLAPPSMASGKSGVSTARKLVRAAEGPLHWILKAPKINVSSLRGDKVVAITAGLDEFISNVDYGLTQAGRAAGVTVVADNPTTLSSASNDIQQAVAEHANAIIINSWETSQLEAPVKAAVKAGIPVIQEFEHNPGPLTSVEKAAGVYANVSVCYTCGGKLMADAIVAASKGNAHIVLVRVPAIGTATEEANGFVSQTRRLCPKCTITQDSAPIPEWTTLLPSLTTSALANPTVNYLVPVFDTMAPLMEPAVFSASAQTRVQFAGHSGDLAELKEMRSGKPPRWVANPGYDEHWAGWATMDDVYRALLGKPAIQDEGLRLRLFTPKNIHSIDLTAPLSAWYGKVNYQVRYKGLWGLG